MNEENELLFRAPANEEEAAAQQEAYYWHILGEFLAMNRVFGQTKVLGDLKLLREKVEGKKEEPRIQLL